MLVFTQQVVWDTQCSTVLLYNRMDDDYMLMDTVMHEWFQLSLFEDMKTL